MPNYVEIENRNLVTLRDIARATGIPACTLTQYHAVGIFAPPRIVVGKRRFYTADEADAIVSIVVEHRKKTTYQRRRRTKTDIASFAK